MALKIYFRIVIQTLAIAVLLFGVYATGSAASPIGYNGSLSSSANNFIEVQFGGTGYTNLGEWYAESTISPGVWDPSSKIKISTTLTVTEEHLTALAFAGYKVDSFCVLVTAERTFDSEGWFRMADDERMSTLVTPTGLAIEGGIVGAATKRFGYYGFNTPIDEYMTKPLSAAVVLPAEAADAVGRRQVTFAVEPALSAFFVPPGIYRIRLDYGIVSKGRIVNLNCEAFARRPFFSGRAVESHMFSPPIRASSLHAGGYWVDANALKPRIPWVILNSYNSNGYNGVIADEDKSHFALSPRTIIPDDVILPLYDANGKKLSYSLEPQFPTDTIELRNNIPWDYTKGELNVTITAPDGKVTNLGKAPFIAKSGNWPTTKKSAFTAWQPPTYGQYTVNVTGWTADIWGNRHEGGGTYHFWIANRMTLATATFQGMAYPVGSKYGRDIAFSPAVPADVEVEAVLYVNSNPNNTLRLSFAGKASPSGVFSGAQGNKQLSLDAPGEYHAHILAKYWDKDGNLWVSTMRHAGVVYEENSPIIARGKKVTIGGKYYDRGETKTEGYVNTSNGISYLQHINFPFQSGDVLLIASEQQGANKIEPMLTYELKNNPAPYESRLQTIGATNLQLKTSNGLSPHMFPEYITDWAYYYAGAPRPGFMSRFIVGEDGLRAPYWPTSPNSFGGQINASSNGDLPGDIYRLIGGIVLKQKEKTPAYAGYLSSAFILPKGSNNNRVIEAGSEELVGSDGTKARFFLTGTRPGMVYEVGATFAPAVQIDPVLPVEITFKMTYPDGRQVIAQGTGDKFGTFAGKDRWTLDVPGLYTFTLEANWQGFTGRMPGLPVEGGQMYVIEKERPADATGLILDIPQQSTFPANGVLTISGTSTGKTVYYAAVIPGAVITQGTVPVENGKFTYTFDPVAISKATPTYDIVNLVNGKSEIKDVVHLTFFSKEKSPSGAVYHSFIRVIIRGTTVLYTK
jgi:hypothetical protein